MEGRLSDNEREVALGSSDNLISTTDLEGRILYANERFLKVAGYRSEEMVGKPHNMIRHPDMPKEAFKEMWGYLHAGKSWMGIVKNRCKRGDHYWVNAYVTPVYDGSNIVGYQSVRVKPTKSQIENATHTYRFLKKRHRLPISSLPVFWKIFLSIVLPLSVISYALTSSQMEQYGLILLWLMGLFTMLVSWVSLRPLRKLTEQARQIFDSPVAQRVYFGEQSEFSTIHLGFEVLQARLKTVTGRLKESADELSLVMNDTNRLVGETEQSSRHQESEVDNVATSIDTLSRSTEDIAGHTRENLTEVQDVSKDIYHATSAIDNLIKEMHGIADVVQVISQISERTNMLALNASIEAARAGEHGRGFSVVAEEVRALAGKTQDSTNRVEEIISTIQNTVNQAVENISRSESSEIRLQEDLSLSDQIQVAVERIEERAGLAAKASLEQVSVAEDVNRHIATTRRLAKENVTSAQETRRLSDQLVRLIEKMNSMSRAFDVGRTGN